MGEIYDDVEEDNIPRAIVDQIYAIWYERAERHMPEAP
jgi:hypothetical protein